MNRVFKERSHTIIFGHASENKVCIMEIQDMCSLLDGSMIFIFLTFEAIYGRVNQRAIKEMKCWGNLKDVLLSCYYSASKCVNTVPELTQEQALVRLIWHFHSSNFLSAMGLVKLAFQRPLCVYAQCHPHYMATSSAIKHPAKLTKQWTVHDHH